MFRLIKVSLVNFAIHKNSVIYFPKDINTFVITGDNRENPSLQNEGVGKSLVFDAISWCIYSVVIRKIPVRFLRGSDGVNFSVTCVFLDENNKKLILKRTGGKIKNVYYSYNGEKLNFLPAKAQPLLDNLFGITFSTFISSLGRGQGDDVRFTDMTDAGMKNLVTELNNLSIFDKCYKNISNSTKETESNYIRIETEIRVMKDNLSKSLEILKINKEKFKKIKSQTHDDIEELLEKHLNKLNILNENIIILVNENKKLKKVKSVKNKYKKYKLNYDELLKEYNLIYEEIVINKSFIKSSNQVIDKMNVFLDKIQISFEDEAISCSFCGTKLTPNTKENNKKHIRKNIRKEERNIEKIKENLNTKFQPSLGLINKRKLKLEEEITILEHENEEYGESVNNIIINENKIKSVVKDIDSLDTNYHLNVKRIKEKSKLIKRQINGFEKSIEILSDEINVKTEELNKLNIVVGDNYYMKKAFGKNGIKAQSMVETIYNIEELMNKYLEQVTDGQIQVEFNLDDKQNIEFIVNDSTKTELIPYSAFSGGEKSRIRFCGDLAINMLSENNIGLILLDEPFSGLSPNGIFKVLQLLRDVNKYDNKLILCITHNVHATELFDNRIHLIRERGIAYVE